MKRYGWGIGILAIVCLGAWYEPTGSVRGYLRGEPFFAGRSTGHWERLLASDDPAQSDAALAALSDGGSAASAVLCALTRRLSAPPEVRWNAAELLGKAGIQSAEVSETLLAALRDPDPHVRTVAADAVPKVQTEAVQAVPALSQLLDTQHDVPIIRALSVYREQAQPALPRLRELMNDRSLPSEVRWNAARTIGKMGAAGAAAVPALIPLMKDEEPTVREHAAEAAGDIGPAAESAVPALLETLTDSFHKARRDAVRSLGQIGGDTARSAVPEIEKMLSDPEEIVRVAARKTLEQLTGTAPAEPAGSAKPTEPAKPMEPAKPTDSAQPAEPAQP